MKYIRQIIAFTSLHIFCHCKHYIYKNIQIKLTNFMLLLRVLMSIIHFLCDIKLIVSTSFPQKTLNLCLNVQEMSQYFIKLPVHR